MIGVTIGTGDYFYAAVAAARKMGEMTGLQCAVISQNFANAVHPSWLKCKIIDHFPVDDSFLVFDADIACIQSWNPQQIFESLGRPFCAVPDIRSQCTLGECQFLNIPWPDLYVNGGLTMFGREHKPIWDFVWSHHPSCGAFLEQGALNIALMETRQQVCRLPRRFNVVTNAGRIFDEAIAAIGAVNIHCCDLLYPAELLKFGCGLL